MTSKNTTLNFFKDKNDKVVLGQTPNLPLIAWIIFSVSARILTDARLAASLKTLATASAFTWAYLEASSGVTKFRKLMGVTFLIAICIATFRNS
jgi:hypothetical protein